MFDAPDPHLQDKAFLLIWMRGLEDSQINVLAPQLDWCAFTVAESQNPPEKAAKALARLVEAYGERAVGTWLGVHAAYILKRRQDKEDERAGFLATIKRGTKTQIPGAGAEADSPQA